MFGRQERQTGRRMEKMKKGNVRKTVRKKHAMFSAFE
jgi:hypothetical protein